jgi:2-(1,2-epoxy-1,2-dihydrophenyl)acetyl-CoA isomerase
MITLDERIETAPDGLLAERVGAALHLRFDRAARRNALTDELVLALTELIEGAGNDDNVRVIELGAVGADFCSGFDLGTRGDSGGKPRTGATQRSLRAGVNRLIPTMLECQTPIVTTITGWAIGLGLNIVLASDFAVVAADARLRAPFVGLGFTPDSGSSWLIPRLAGVARAKEILLLGHEFSGSQAADWGLVHRAVAPGDVTTTAAELAAELAAAPTVAVGLAKLLIERSASVDLERHLADEGLAIELASRSNDFHEAMRARREKRPPSFEGM